MLFFVIEFLSFVSGTSMFNKTAAHARIRPQFSGCARFVKDTLADIVEGRLLVTQLPLITLTSGAADGLSPPYFSLNNRRLWVLKELRTRGLLGTVSARCRPTQDSHRLREKCGCCFTSLVGSLTRWRLAGTPSTSARSQPSLSAKSPW
jgi:hypothetical protein